MYCIIVSDNFSRTKKRFEVVPGSIIRPYSERGALARKKNIDLVSWLTLLLPENMPSFRSAEIMITLPIIQS